MDSPRVTSRAVTILDVGSKSGKSPAMDKRLLHLQKQQEAKYEEYMESNEQALRHVLEGGNGFWLFGYGSIIWKRDFHFDREIVGYIKGYVRRFWQKSMDHRGTVEKPGRVVTLVPQDDQESTTWGIAYHVPASHTREVINGLNFREKNGYSVHIKKFHPRESTEQEKEVFLYVASEDNDSFFREDNLDELAAVIARSVGPSGANSEYLLNLAEGLRQHGIMAEDDIQHVYVLETKVKELLNNNIPT